MKYRYIEKSTYRKGEYVAYYKGAQRIRRFWGGWKTYELGSSEGEFTLLLAETLSGMDERIHRLLSDTHQPRSARP